MICKPPAKAFAPLEHASDADKAYVEAWTLLKEHLREPYKSNANWTHAMVTAWAANDTKTPKAKVNKGVPWPPVMYKCNLPRTLVSNRSPNLFPHSLKCNLLIPQRVLAQIDLQPMVENPEKLTIFIVIQDPFSYNVQATAKANSVTITLHGPSSSLA